MELMNQEVNLAEIFVIYKIFELAFEFIKWKKRRM